MTTESVVINAPAPVAKPLEQEAIELGIDVNSVDPTAPSQAAVSAEKKILGKFENVDALAQAYTELEKKLGSNSKKPAVPNEQEVKPSETPAEAETNEDEPKTAEEQAKEAVESAGLNFEELSNKFWSNGEKLDDADYAKLEKANFPRALVDQFIEGQKAVVALQRQTVLAS